MILTYRYRIKNNESALVRQASAINFVWNFFNDRQKDALRWSKQWPSAFDLEKLTAGSSKELGIHTDSICALAGVYAKSRKQSKRPFLRYRGKQSLLWVPFKGRNIRSVSGGFTFLGVTYRVFDSRPIPHGAKFADGGSFSQDARGRWYINIPVEIPDAQPRPQRNAVGIDLGLKDLACMSNGEKVENPRHVAKLANKLAVAKRARKKRQAAKVHAKITNTRRDHLHKLSTRIVRAFDYIAVGDVNAAGLAKTNMAKSVLDAGWSTLRTMLAYKSIANGAKYEEVDESFSTRVCSGCGSASGPKGIADLGMRMWCCSECGASHDRDINSAVNILFRSGHRSPVEGIAA